MRPVRWNYATAVCDPTRPDAGFYHQSPTGLLSLIEDVLNDAYFSYVRQSGTPESDTCMDYEGQKDGKWTFETYTGSVGEDDGVEHVCIEAGCPNKPATAFGRDARTDVEGCCWWGRGVIQTTGEG